MSRQSIPLLDLTSVRPSEMLPFHVQPLLRPSTANVFGFEVLYRGVHPTSPEGWISVDETVLGFLSSAKMDVTLFINLSNRTILTIDEALLFAAHAKNSIYFEWSEVISDESQFREIIRKIADWTQRGLRFVIDDFGAGRDGFERLFAIESVTAIKFDGGFFRMASVNPMARNLVEHVIRECRNKDILTVGECIETASDYQLAERLGLDLVQGFYVDDVYVASAAPLAAMTA